MWLEALERMAYPLSTTRAGANQVVAIMRTAPVEQEVPIQRVEETAAMEELADPKEAMQGFLEMQGSEERWAVPAVPDALRSPLAVVPLPQVKMVQTVQMEVAARWEVAVLEE